jgi:acetate kinase
MADAILTLNAGSSSIKFALIEATPALARIAAGEIENIGAAPHFWVRIGGMIVHEKRWLDGSVLSHEDLLTPLLDWVEAHQGDVKLVAAGHRIVHGGSKFTLPVRLDAAVLAELATLNQLAPLHEPHNLAAVAAVMALRPQLPQIGCFDTAFHHTAPDVAKRLALPRHFYDDGIRRYGFHGLSYEYIAGRLREKRPHLAAGRVIAAHLGNGASMCAMRDGLSVDSTMGFTALDGLMMGTRCGSIDPGAVLYFVQTLGMTADNLTSLLYKQSGLLGVSGISADMRVLLGSSESAAAEAVNLFCTIAAKQLAALTVAAGGIDAIVFTAGIGEHAPEVRARICANLHHFGIRLDAAANSKNAETISTSSSTVEVLVIPTDEEAMIALHCLTFL